MCAQVSRAVQAWEPREERIPLHAWLHPWLELLGRQLEDLYPTIRFKLASALQSWHPSDGSALALLSPWHTVRKENPISQRVCMKRMIEGVAACTVPWGTGPLASSWPHLDLQATVLFHVAGDLS